MANSSSISDYSITCDGKYSCNYCEKEYRRKLYAEFHIAKYHKRKTVIALNHQEIKSPKRDPKKRGSVSKTYSSPKKRNRLDSILKIDSDEIVGPEWLPKVIVPRLREKSEVKTLKYDAIGNVDKAVQEFNSTSSFPKIILSKSSLKNEIDKRVTISLHNDESLEIKNKFIERDKLPLPTNTAFTWKIQLPKKRKDTAIVNPPESERGFNSTNEFKDELRENKSNSNIEIASENQNVKHHKEKFENPNGVSMSLPVSHEANNILSNDLLEKCRLNGDNSNCETCKVVFVSKVMLDHHVANQHNKCGTCNHILMDRNALIEHIRTRHSELVCEFCNDVFESTEMLQSHIKDHSKCSICDCVLSSHDTLFQHMELCHTNLTCDVCKNIYNSEDALQHHISKDHVKCEICDIILLTRIALFKHIHLEHAFLRCAICRMVTFSIADKMRHVESKHANLICYVCKKLCYSRSELISHKASHLSCVYCSLAFMDEQKLNSHVAKFHLKKIHSWRKEDDIAYCKLHYRKKQYVNARDESQCSKKKDENAKDLISHLVAKIKEENIIMCFVCSFFFSSPYYYKRHLKYKHNIVSCDLCSHCSSSEEELLLHLMTFHSDRVADLRQCLLCKHVCPSIADLTAHLADWHEKCEVCVVHARTKEALFIHSQDHNMTLFNCYICLNTHDSYHLLFLHVKNSHAYEKWNALQLCLFCRSYLPTKINCEIHRGTVHVKDTSFKCRYCVYSHASSKKYVQHLLQNHEFHECEICGALIQYSGKLLSHISMHHPNSRLIQFLNTNQDFVRKINDIYYIPSTNNYQRDACESDKDNIKIKPRFRTEVVCKFCGQLFSHNIHFSNHVLSHLKTEISQIPATIGISNYINQSAKKSSTSSRIVEISRAGMCHFCHNHFSNQNHLDAHMLDAHGQVNQLVKSQSINSIFTPSDDNDVIIRDRRFGSEIMLIVLKKSFDKSHVISSSSITHEDYFLVGENKIRIEPAISPLTEMSMKKNSNYQPSNYFCMQIEPASSPLFEARKKKSSDCQLSDGDGDFSVICELGSPNHQNIVKTKIEKMFEVSSKMTRNGVLDISSKMHSALININERNCNIADTSPKLPITNDPSHTIGVTNDVTPASENKLLSRRKFSVLNPLSVDSFGNNFHWWKCRSLLEKTRINEPNTSSIKKHSENMLSKVVLLESEENLESNLKRENAHLKNNNNSIMISKLKDEIITGNENLVEMSQKPSYPLNNNIIGTGKINKFKMQSTLVDEDLIKNVEDKLRKSVQETLSTSKDNVKINEENYVRKSECDQKWENDENTASKEFQELDNGEELTSDEEFNEPQDCDESLSPKISSVFIDGNIIINDDDMEDDQQDFENNKTIISSELNDEIITVNENMVEMSQESSSLQLNNNIIGRGNINKLKMQSTLVDKILIKNIVKRNVKDTLRISVQETLSSSRANMKMNEENDVGISECNKKLGNDEENTASNDFQELYNGEEISSDDKFNESLSSKNSSVFIDGNIIIYDDDMEDDQQDSENNKTIISSKLNDEIIIINENMEERSQESSSLQLNNNIIGRGNINKLKMQSTPVDKKLIKNVVKRNVKDTLRISVQKTLSTSRANMMNEENDLGKSECNQKWENNENTTSNDFQELDNGEITWDDEFNESLSSKNSSVFIDGNIIINDDDMEDDQQDSENNKTIISSDLNDEVITVNENMVELSQESSSLQLNNNIIGRGNINKLKIQSTLVDKNLIRNVVKRNLKDTLRISVQETLSTSRANMKMNEENDLGKSECNKKWENNENTASNDFEELGNGEELTSNDEYNGSSKNSSAFIDGNIIINDDSENAENSTSDSCHESENGGESSQGLEELKDGVIVHLDRIESDIRSRVY